MFRVSPSHEPLLPTKQTRLPQSAVYGHQFHVNKSTTKQFDLVRQSSTVKATEDNLVLLSCPYRGVVVQNVWSPLILVSPLACSIVTCILWHWVRWRNPGSAYWLTYPFKICVLSRCYKRMCAMPWCISDFVQGEGESSMAYNTNTDVPQGDWDREGSSRRVCANPPNVPL